MDLVLRHAEPVGDHLRIARLVPLPVRQGADDCHFATGVEAQFHALVEDRRLAVCASMTGCRSAAAAPPLRLVTRSDKRSNALHGISGRSFDDLAREAEVADAA
jgi:hypothetical protein